MSPGSLSFAKLVVMSFAPAKSAEDTRYASQDPFIQSTLSHTSSTPICIRSAFFLRRTQLIIFEIHVLNLLSFRFKIFCMIICNDTRQHESCILLLLSVIVKV